VNPAPTDVYLTSVPASLFNIQHGHSVPFTAKVRVERPSQTSIPDGSVKFTRSSTDPNPVVVPLVDGVATTSLTFTQQGRTTVTATYLPSANYETSSDSVVAHIQ